MGKRYRCVANQSIGSHFLPGRVYTLNEDGSMMGERGYAFKGHKNRNAAEWLQDQDWYTFEEVNDMFTMNDLDTGMLVELRNRKHYLVLKNCCCKDSAKLMLIGVDSVDAKNEKCYNDNLTHKYIKNYDIMRVCKPYCYPELSNIEYEFTREDHIMYDRSKIDERKRMTVEEIEQKLGYKIAVVDSEGK